MDDSPAYRWRRTDDGDHPFAVFGPDGYDTRWTVLVNAACEGVARSNQANVARWATALLAHLHGKEYGRCVIRMEAGRTKARGCIRAFLSAKGYKLTFAGQFGGFEVSRADGRLSDVDHGIRVLSKLFGLMPFLFGRRKKDPMRASKRLREYRRAMGERRWDDRRQRGARRHRPRRAPSDRFFTVKRSGARKWGGPPPLVRGIGAIAAEAAVEDGWPEALRVQQIIEAGSGCRDFEARTRTLHDLLVAGDENSLASTSKNHGEERVKRLVLNTPRMEAVFAYVDEARAARDGGRGLAYWRGAAARARAGDVEAEAELKAAPLLLGSRPGRPPSYRSKARHFSRSMSERDVSATGHMQRHEHTTLRLEEIDAMTVDEETKASLRREHGRYKHWADPEAMFEIYGVQATSARRTRLEIEFQDRQDAGVLAAQRRGAEEIDLPSSALPPGIDFPAAYGGAFADMPE